MKSVELELIFNLPSHVTIEILLCKGNENFTCISHLTLWTYLIIQHLFPSQNFCGLKRIFSCILSINERLLFHCSSIFEKLIFVPAEGSNTSLVPSPMGLFQPFLNVIKFRVSKVCLESWYNLRKLPILVTLTQLLLVC